MPLATLRTQLHPNSLLCQHLIKLIALRSQFTHVTTSPDDGATALESSTLQERRRNRVPLLKQFGRDLTDEARRGLLDPVIGRDALLQRMVHVLLRRTKNNVLLLGDPGVGKTAIAEGIAQVIVSQAHSRLHSKRLISLDVAGLLAGTQYRGTFEERFHGILNEVQQSHGSVMLFIDEVHNLVGAGAVEGALDAANMLKPALARGALHCIGATTHEEYERHIARDAALARRFQPLPVPEPTPAEALAILQGLSPRYEAFHAVTYTPAALECAVTSAVQYSSSRRLPDAAVDTIDEAAAFATSLPPQAGAASGAAGAAEQRRLEAARAPVLRAFAPAAHTPPLTGSRKAVVALPKACPHCGFPVPDVGTTSLLCTECSSAFLNIPQHLLMLGASVTPRRKPKAVAASQPGEGGVATHGAGGGKPGAPPVGGAAAAASRSPQAAEGRLVVDSEAVLQVVSQQIGIPVGQLRGDPHWFADVRQGLQMAVLGQDRATRAVIEAAKRAHTRALHSGSLSRVGSVASGRGARCAPALLLRGPRGTGKTLLCRAVAEQLFPDASSVLWLDMAQFAAPGAQVLLFGPPPGTVGHAEGGILTRLLRRHRRALVVLEDAEQAHPEAQALLASMLRRGAVQDGTRTLDCSHMWLLATTSSRLGDAAGAAAAGGDGSGGSSATAEGGGLGRGAAAVGGPGLLGVLRSALEAPAELEDLRPEVLQQIAQRELEGLAQRWWVSHGLRLSWSAEVVAGVAAGKACVGLDAAGVEGGEGSGGRAGHAVVLAIESIKAHCWLHLEREGAGENVHVAVQGDRLVCSAPEEPAPGEAPL
eukprot:jgi/Ulvmu1/575/UM001_0583.1